MKVRLLGTAAGGAFPQWNCNCRNCKLARQSPEQAAPRTQSSVAVSADGARWFLLNASPDVRIQIESFPPLLGKNPGVRTTGIEAILLTNADLDHVLGLYILREGSPLNVYATKSVRISIQEGLGIDKVLASYCGVRWREPAMEESDLLTGDNVSSGLRYQAFPVSGKPPRYKRDNAAALLTTIGYKISDPTTGARMLFVPDMDGWDEELTHRAKGCDAILVDGTFWSNDELSRERTGTTTASEMGHLPISPPNGSLLPLSRCDARLKIYVHINNTNPILREASSERRMVNDAGILVGRDGMELNL